VTSHDPREPEPQKVEPARTPAMPGEVPSAEKPKEPALIDDMPVAPLTTPEETTGG
jgi:hypothetical protein